jgi:F-type H+-transporting ATPase subunit a
MTTLRHLWWKAAFAAIALMALPGVAAAAEDEDFDPSLEFQLDPYVPIELGPIDLSINKAVVYLLLSTFIICVGGVWVVRGGLRMRPTRAQNFVEIVYEFTEEQVAKQGLSARTMPTWFPYIAALFLFIAVNNIISFVPLPVSHEVGAFPFGIPDFGLYAATANINVTLTLTIITFVATHYVGVQYHGVGGYLKTWIPDAPGPIKPFLFVIEVLSQLLRLVSLSVRLFANLLAGHLLIIICAGFTILIGGLLGVVAIPIAVFFWIFEWVLVAGLQAFVFALLSGIYIGYAADPPH